MAVPLAKDTSPDIEARQVRSWRAMTPAQKADLITSLSRAARELALAGIRHRYPDAAPHEHTLRLAMLTLGPELARQVHPDIDTLGLE